MAKSFYDYLKLSASMQFACIDYLKDCVPTTDALVSFESLYEQVSRMDSSNTVDITVFIDDKEFVVPFDDKKDALLYVTYLYQIIDEKLNGEVK